MSEIDRLVGLGDANAILDELQQRRTEWDDARAALDRLIDGSAQVIAAADVDRAGTVREREALRDEVERLRSELEARCDVEDCEQYREWLSWEKANADAQTARYRLAWWSARRGRAEARDQVKAARPYIDWLHERRRSLFDDRDRLSEENDRLRSDIEAAKRGWHKDVATVERVRALDLHKASVHPPDECVRDCPGCAIERAIEGEEETCG